MKKMFSIMLAFILLFPFSCVYAEKFTLHNNTEFGMSKEEVREIEESKLQDYVEYPGGIVNGFYATWTDPVMISGCDTIAKLKNTLVAYCFGGGGKGLLNNLRYFFETPDSYDYIEQSLIQKYGVTEYTHINGLSPEVFLFNDGSPIKDGKWGYEIVRYSHRIINLDDKNYVVIQHIVFNSRPRSGVHALVYHLADYYDREMVNNYFNKVSDDL